MQSRIILIFLLYSCVMVCAILLVAVSATITDDATWLKQLYNQTGGNTTWSSSCRSGWNLINASTAYADVTVCNGALNGVMCTLFFGNPFVTSISLSGCGLSGPLPTVSTSEMASLQSLFLNNNALTGSPPALQTLYSMQSLMLSNNYFTGSIPSSWSSLSSLQYLSVSRNKLSGALPVWSMNVPSLQVLDFSYNSLSATLPMAWSTRVTSLQSLYLQYNSLSGSLPSDWSSLSSLTSLSISYNSLDGVLPGSWASMTSLQSLLLDGNLISGLIPSTWFSLWKLTLSLDNNMLSGALPEIGPLQSGLHSLSLRNNGITGTLPASWSSLSALRSLSLQYNSLNGSLPSAWSNLSSLTSLSISNNRLYGSLPSNWSALTSLQSLSLSSNSLSGSLPETWSNMTSLRLLLLDSNTFDGTLPTNWSSLSSLQYLFLENNRLSGSLPSAWSSMRYLQGLLLDSNSLSGLLSSNWLSLMQLYTLSLSSNMLSGVLPDLGSSQSALQSLSLQNNRLAGTLPSSWSSMSSLQSLSLQHTRLSGSLPSTWSNISSLISLHLSNNALNGSLPSSWSALNSLQSLSLSSNSLSSSLPETWSNMSSLQSLLLDSNSLNESLPTYWSYLTQLNTLSISNNMISGSLPSSWTSLSSLHSLSLQNNSLRGIIPHSWTNLSSLQSFTLADNFLHGVVPQTISSVTLSYCSLDRNCFLTDKITISLRNTRFATCTISSQRDVMYCLHNLISQTETATSSVSSSATCLRTRSTTSSVSRRSSVSAVRLSKSSSDADVSTTTVVSASFSHPTSHTTSGFYSSTTSSSLSSKHSSSDSLWSSSSISLPVNSATSSLSLSTCGEVAMCWARQATNTTCHGCTLLDPRLEAVSLGNGAVVNAQISQEALDRTAFEPLNVYVECIRSLLLKLVNRSTATLDVVVTTPRGSEGLELIQLSLPTGAAGVQQGSGDWLRWSPQVHRQSPYRPLTMTFPLAAECGNQSVNVTLEVLVTPLALPELAVGAAVQATDRATTWLGAIGGGASSGGGASRVAALRSLLLCSKEGASTGGLLGLSLPRSSDGDGDDVALLANARGAIVGNTLVLVVWLGVLLVLAGVYYRRVSLQAADAVSPGLAACVRVALPSSLLPVCSALLPSLSGGVLILAAVGGTRLDAVDILTLVTGCCVLVVVLAPLFLMCAPSFATSMLNAALVGVDSGAHRIASDRITPKECTSVWQRDWTAEAALLWRRAVKPRWMWRPIALPCAGSNNDRTPSAAPRLHGSSPAALGCSVILVEHRCLWYATLDMWSLCVTGLLAAASGVFGTEDMSSTSVCRGAAVALTALFLLQFAVVVTVRPLTSVFANVHAAFVLLLTGLGTALQAASIATRTGSSSGAVQGWALLGAAICGFLVVGATLMKVVLMDAPHTVGIVRKFFLEVSGFQKNETSLEKIEETEELKCCPREEPPPPEACALVVDDVLDVDALNRGFWDEMTGEVLRLEKERGDEGRRLLVGASAASRDDHAEICEGGEALLLHFRV